MLFPKQQPVCLTTDKLIATVFLAKEHAYNVEINKAINKAAFLLSKISIFQMPHTLVHSYARLDCMLHGVISVNSWESAIGLLDKLKSEGCPKKSLLDDAKEILLAEQMAAFSKGVPAKAEVKTDAVWSTPAWVQKMADTPDAPEPKKPAFAAPPTVKLPPYESETKATVNKPGFYEPSYVASPAVDAAANEKKWNVNAPNIQQIPKDSIPSPAPVNFKAIKGCAIQTLPNHVLVKTPYNPQFVNALKTLPVPDRKWDTANQVWVVAVAHKSWVLNLMNSTFPDKVQELTA